MTKATPHVPRHANAVVSGAGVLASALLAAFAMTATPVVAEFAKRFDFQLASYSAAIFRLPTWTVLLASVLAAALILVKDRMLTASPTKLIVGSILTTLMLGVLAAYVFSVLQPIAQVEQHMKALDVDMQTKVINRDAHLRNG
ncbi:MAG TPA: hypothetical protein VGB55_11445 [Tepidisphaeraceae bacterium]